MADDKLEIDRATWEELQKRVRSQGEELKKGREMIKELHARLNKLVPRPMPRTNKAKDNSQS